MGSGTSMACPHVAGAAALILSHDPTTHAKSKATQDAITQRLLGMATPDMIATKPETVNKLLNVKAVKKFPDPEGMRMKIIGLFVLATCMVKCVLIGMGCFAKKKYVEHKAKKAKTIIKKEIVTVEAKADPNKDKDKEVKIRAVANDKEGEEVELGDFKENDIGIGKLDGEVMTITRPNGKMTKTIWPNPKFHIAEEFRIKALEDM